MAKIAPNITVNAKVRFGKPVIEGTRVPVDEVSKRYGLTKKQVLAALRYAADFVLQEEVALQ